MAASYDDGSVLRRRQHTTTTAASYNEDRRWQRHDKGNCRLTKAFVLTADNRTSYEDNGNGLYWWNDDDTIGGSISLVRVSKHGVRRW